MATLPVDRVVDVNLTRADNFATRTGFGVPLFVTSDTSGPLDATTRTKVYGSLNEVVADYAVGTEPHNMASVAFSQEIAPAQIKIGWYDTANLATINAELDLIMAYDSDWYWLGFEAAVRASDAAQDAIIVWTQAQRKQAGLDDNDVLMESAADATNVAARNKNSGYDRSWVFYHTNTALYPAIAFMSRLATYNFDDPNNAYTGKFKRLTGITPVNIGSAAVQAITGFVPGIGLDQTNGHLANTYVNVGGVEMTLEGTNLGEAFIDEVHAGDWIVSRTEEAILGICANNPRIPYTNRGVQMIVSGVEEILNRAAATGLIADTEDENGNILPAYRIVVDRVENIAISQRRQRIAPTIQAYFRYAGAIHWTRVDYTMQF